MTIFEKAEDYDAFLRALDETWRLVPLPIFAFTVMPNHWHVVRPAAAGQVSEFFRRLTVTHTMRWHAHYGMGGSGAVNDRPPPSGAEGDGMHGG
jgi:putative transposase